jgi:NADP-reducing hydrogenase subunit HndC
MICTCTNCVSNGALQIRDSLEAEIQKQALQDEIQIVPTGAGGLCVRGPILIVQPEGVFYQSLTEKDIPQLVEEHFLKGRPVESLMYAPPGEETPIPKIRDIPFFKSQRLIALRNRGLIDPEKIDEYIANDGYRALAKVLTSMSPEEVVEEIKDSGLRGRGGAGFPTGRKWDSARKAPGDIKYVICNADEGDPGAFMDRSIIEADPHSVIEGMAIGGYAVGSSQGYVYIRVEYPFAIERLKVAIDQAMEYGLLGQSIMGSDFDFHITVFKGAGAFVCGESSSLRASIEGRIPEPVSKHVHATEKGLWEKPTVLNNVETLANVPAIINWGAKWFSAMGTENSKGTKVFSLAGNINNAGLVEVPMGTSLREIIYDIGGGIPGNKKLKAIQTGGPSGGCIPEQLLDLPVDYEGLQEAGSIMGSGGMIVMDENTCMVDVSKYFIDFLRDESCGKCTSCRDGLDAMYGVLSDICEGSGKEGDLELLHELSEGIKVASLCQLGQTAPNLVLTTLRYFEDEYELHIREKKCPAGVCKALIKYLIDESKCTGCMLCGKNCPVGVISGEKKQPQKIDVEKCIRCGACVEICRFEAVLVE